jgi:hypothetical protein
VPLAVAFILIGALPTVPGLTLIEKNLREYAHKRAYIPDAARATADRLAAADFDFTSYQDEALESPEMRGVEPADFKRSRRSLGHSWARLCCLVYAQANYRMSGLTEPLDASLRGLRKRIWSSSKTRSNRWKPRLPPIEQQRRATRSTPTMTCAAPIRDNLYKLYILLGCAVRLKQQPMKTSTLRWRSSASGSAARTRGANPAAPGLQLVGLTWSL